jgi:predicted dehydrogenase
MDSFEAGAHVIVEKPATSTFGELETLVRCAQAAGRHLIEDYNYVSSRTIITSSTTPPRRSCDALSSGT